MKISRFIIVLLLITCTLLPAQSKPWSIRLSGGYGSMTYDHFNNKIESYNEAQGTDGFPKMESMKNNFAGDIEVLFPVKSFLLGFHIGYWAIPELDYATGSTEDMWDAEGTYNHTVKVLPIGLLARYELPKLAFLQPFAGAGIDYYMVDLTFDELTEGRLTYSENHYLTRTTQTDMTSDQFGLRAFLGLAFDLSNRLCLDVRVNAKWANLGGFVGTQKFKETDEGPVGTKTWEDDRGVYLVYSETADGTADYFPREDAAWTVEEKEGKVNLSGFDVSIGLTIQLGQ